MRNTKKLLMAVIVVYATSLPITAYGSTNTNVHRNTDTEYVQVSGNENSNETADADTNNNQISTDQSINYAAYAKEDTNTNEKVSKGWKTIDGNRYYYRDDNTKATGFVEIEDKTYYFDASGKLLSGWLTDSGNKYYLSDSGTVTKGIKKIGDNTYLFSNNGIMLTGWKYLTDNKWYYFNENGTMKTGWFLYNNFKYYLKENGTMAAGWTTIEDKDYYFSKDGAMRAGWIGIGKDIYYLDSNGAKVTNSTMDGYTLDRDGKLVLPSGVTEPDIDLYFTNKNININTEECDYKSKTKGIQESTFKGIDISNHNGYIDFNAVKNAGVKVVYMKVSESDYYIDQYAEENSKNAKTAGLKVGYYHYLTGTSSPEAQARLFYECIKDKPNDLKPCVDVEVSPSTALEYTIRFINEFKKYSNMDVCVYTYTNFINNFDSSLASYSLWEANYNNSPFSLPANSIWNSKAGHQYTCKGYIDGVSGQLDFDMFNHDILL
ncbi:GH25 family lysozyme [uncultured Clostridium sp.]|uniref:GH25 family lysozyme n=1 Tax=uncultured Clostridium sp. TaxID=59620 RepID=UPI0025DF63C6|nr:GH25 family lysozyme [uncultured Clostridium sp.]